MGRKILLTLLLVLVVSAVTVNIYANSFLNNIISQGSNFGNGSASGIGTSMKTFINDEIIPIISLVGNLIFAGVTVILGVKYIWSGAEGKSQVSESLPAFVAAVLFFYLGGTIVTWLTGATSGLSSATSWNTISGKIIGTINMVVRYAAFGGILYMGLRYMFASAEGKSQMKTSMVGVALGIMFVFMASKVVDFIIGIGEGIL